MVANKISRESIVDFSISSLHKRIDRADDPDVPVGNSAMFMVNDIIFCNFLEIRKEVDIFLPTAIKWFDYAILNKEEFGGVGEIDFHHACLFRSKAMAVWLSEHKNDTDSWFKAYQLWSTFDAPNSILYSKMYKTAFLDDFLLLCVQSSQYQAGIDRFEHYHGKKEISIKRKMTPREYGYLLCRNHLEKKYSEEQLLEPGRKMLSRYLEKTWLEMGLYDYAAIWLKIVYWDQHHIATPYDTLQSVFENLPEINNLTYK